MKNSEECLREFGKALCVRNIESLIERDDPELFAQLGDMMYSILEASVELDRLRGKLAEQIPFASKN